MSNIRWGAAALLLFLVVAIDFTSRIMSVLADGTLAAAIVCVVWPLIRKEKK